MSGPAAVPRVLFSDLDGTLLDRRTYAWREAAQALRTVRAHRVPLVLCSSKTRAEQVVHREELRLADPFIVENGAAVFIPEGYFAFDFPHQRRVPGFRVVELGLPAREVHDRLAAVRRETGLPCRGYADMTVREVRRLTGLSEAAATRAMQREYSETLTAVPDAGTTWVEALRAHGLAAYAGGRFCTVTSAGCDKGRAVALLRDLFVRAQGPVETVAIGDGPNDAPMLLAADRAFLVQGPGPVWAEMRVPHLERIARVGPAGWSEVVSRVFGGRRPTAQGSVPSTRPVEGSGRAHTPRSTAR